MDVSSLLSEGSHRSLRGQPPKTISFELLLDEGSKTRARIPLRILVNQHDDTESIITTVKNFYGIYDGQGVSFEDMSGNILIARYENLVDNSVVYVRTVAGPSHWPHPPDLQRRPSLGEPFQPASASAYEQAYSPSRPSSRLARKRSTSPIHGRGRRSVSQQKIGSVSASRGSSASGGLHDDAANGYSDSDAGRSSITGSRKARSEQFVSAEISLDNVVQEGRRVKSLFESSELPLFNPPQVPVTTSTSSISPQRRSLPQEGPSPLHPFSQNISAFNAPPLLSPRSFNFSGQPQGILGKVGELPPTLPKSQYGHRLRERAPASSNAYNRTGRVGNNANGVLPTPDPTVASCISDEDVARQLIALGDMSNLSHGRTSNSTLDDTFSGVADVSSTGATSDSEEYSEDEQFAKQCRLNQEDDDEEYRTDTLIKSEADDYDGEPRTKKIKTKMYDGPSNQMRSSKSSSGFKGIKSAKMRNNTLPKMSKQHSSPGLMKAPSAPATPAQPRKTSSSSSILNFQHQLAPDEEDLSSKPRCQRCRKSKKGCDRQRPCGRCKDAGIGIEGCISEDEGNGRKGRYGRHMGVPVKKSAEVLKMEEDSHLAGSILTSLGGSQGMADKSKKRKR